MQSYPPISYPAFHGKKHLSQRLHEIRRDNAIKKIDDRCPELYMHQHIKLKRLQQIEDGNLALQVDNRLLAERILQNMVRRSQVDCHRVPFYDFQQLRTKLMTRQRKLMRRTLENQAYLKRLAKVKSYYNHKKDELDYQRMHQIVAFKPIKCDLKYYSPLVQFQKKLDVVKIMSRSRLYAANTDTTKPYKKGLWPRRKTVIPGSRAVGGVQGCCNGVNCCQFDVEEIDETPLPSGLKQGKKKVEKCKKASQTDVRKAKKYETNQLYVDEEMKTTKKKKTKKQQNKKEEKPISKPINHTWKKSPYNKSLPPLNREAMIRKAVAEMRINRTKKIDNRPPFVNSAASVKIQREREKREMIEQKKLARKAPTGNYRSNRIKPPVEEIFSPTSSIEPKVTVELENENSEENAEDKTVFLPEGSNEITIEAKSPKKTFIPEQNYNAVTRGRTPNKGNQNSTGKHDHSPIKYSRNYRKGCYKSDIVGHRARMGLIRSLVDDDDIVNDLIEPVQQKKKSKLKNKKIPKKTSGVRFAVSSEDDYETIDELTQASKSEN